MLSFVVRGRSLQIWMFWFWFPSENFWWHHRQWHQKHVLLLNIENMLTCEHPQLPCPLTHSHLRLISESEAGCSAGGGFRHLLICPSDSWAWIWHSAFWLADKGLSLSLPPAHTHRQRQHIHTHHTIWHTRLTVAVTSTKDVVTDFLSDSFHCLVVCFDGNHRCLEIEFDICSCWGKSHSFEVRCSNTFFSSYKSIQFKKLFITKGQFKAFNATMHNMLNVVWAHAHIKELKKNVAKLVGSWSGTTLHFSSSTAFPYMEAAAVHFS